MPNVLLILDFLIPAILFFSGRAMKGDLGRKLQKESVFVLIVAALFAPILFFFFPLAVQGVFCGCVLLLQSVLSLRILYSA